MGTAERRSYDTGASQEAQGNLHGVIARLEAVIGQRDADVKQAGAGRCPGGTSTRPGCAPS
jgi:hypothetical protein